MVKVDSLPEMQGPPYRDDQNRWYTNQMFLERRFVSSTNFKYRPVFTLHEKRPGYICARETFIAIGDPTGYRWALKYLGDYRHFKRLLKLAWFREAMDEWNEELYVFQKSNALTEIENISKESDSDSQRLSAAKYLIEKPYEKDTTKRGRPSKEEVQGELKEAVKMSQQTREEFERIGLRVINGNSGTPKSAS